MRVAAEQGAGRRRDARTVKLCFDSGTPKPGCSLVRRRIVRIVTMLFTDSRHINSEILSLRSARRSSGPLRTSAPIRDRESKG